MNESIAHTPRYTGKIRTKFAEAAAGGAPITVEFVGASDATIAEAVRHALASASRSVGTLDGMGVLVIPQIFHEGAAPRYRVTLQVTAGNPDAPPDRAPSPTR